MTANEPRKPSGEKLQKVLARAGLGSRREMEQLIADGQVQVNGRVAGLGDRVGSDDAVLVRGRKLRTEALQEQPSRVLIYNKPDGEICSRRDPEGRPSVF
ncbi:MAG TPA: S4 domain-containing protein, partial [Spongiibacteraceae bacterium]|nr:S4 domain-containing protein [Spongiibacteraceae bacterium]